jgi:hypothetical protein
MFNQILIVTTFAALAFAGAANAQEQAAVQLPELQSVQRMLESAWQRADEQHFDAFGAPISAPESTLAAQDMFAGGVAENATGQRQLAPGEAQIP